MPHGGSGAGGTGYHHLGTETAPNATYAGYGGLKVSSNSIRYVTGDFVAHRFMKEQECGAGINGTCWLEVGWSQNGWTASRPHHVYTFDTVSQVWQFYDQYSISPGMELWFEILPRSSECSYPVYQALLWWNNTWNVLKEVNVPGLCPRDSRLELYFEIHSYDTAHFAISPAYAREVQVLPPGGNWTYWTPSTPTQYVLTQNEGYCTTFTNNYYKWNSRMC